MFCTNCGAARQANSNFCGSCGTGFAVANSQLAATTLQTQTSKVQPSPTFTNQTVPPAGRATITDIYYWVLATSPIAILIIDGIITSAFGQNASAAIGTFFAIVFVLTALSLDSSQLRKLGIRVPFWMGALLPPLYLFKRAKGTGRNQAAFITWLSTYALLTIVTLAGLGGSSSAVDSDSYRAGQQAGYQASQDRFNDLFASIEDSCAAKSDYYSWSNYEEFIQGCVDEYRYQTE